MHSILCDGLTFQENKNCSENDFFHANSSFDLLLDVQQEHIKELEKTVADLKGIFNCKSYLWRRYLKYVLIRSCATLLVLQCKAI